ncbi:MAG TPA: HNH endonuclease signature motif containing protein [Puia sp.]|nr:HNH endonuclease signature motif containing protein [Puia sp.]
MNGKRRLRVLRRDRWQCMMPSCLHPRNRVIVNGLPHDDPWAASIDHIIPKAYGGTDRLDNLRAAHRLCNGVRGSGARVVLEGVARGPSGGILRGPEGGLLSDPVDVLGPRWRKEQQ